MAAEHTFTCDYCELNIFDSDTKKVHYCPECGGEMRWNMTSFMSSSGGDFYHESRSMGCSAKQVNDMRKAYPGAEYKKKGKSYVLVTRSAGEMDKRLQERNMVKYTKKDLQNANEI